MSHAHPTLDVTVPLTVKPKSNGSHGKNTNWKAAKVKEDKAAIMSAVVEADDSHPAIGKMAGWLAVNPDIGARVTMLRPYTSQPLDDDNLGNAFKDARDVVASFLGADDSSPRYHWRCTQVKATLTGKKMNKAKWKRVKDKVTGIVTKVRTTPKLVPDYDTHIRIRIEIVPASDVDPMKLAVRSLSEVCRIYASELFERGFEASAALVLQDVSRADALASFEPKELYDV